MLPGSGSGSGSVPGFDYYSRGESGLLILGFFLCARDCSMEGTPIMVPLVPTFSPPTDRGLTLKGTAHIKAQRRGHLGDRGGVIVAKDNVVPST